MGKEAGKKESRGKKKFSASTMILVGLLLAGIGIMLYPAVSDYWNSFHQTRAIAGYDEAVAGMEQEDYDTLFAEAERYNERLLALNFPLGQYEQLEEAYDSAMDITGTGIMGYVTIPSIDVELPVYHGTSESVLNVAAGHLEGSSLPIGGESTHAVLSAHRGLPTAKLFTRLDRLKQGDVFMITVLDRLLTYEVDQVLVVLPEELDALYIQEGRDYVTLQTCTPYGINSHRLLVRGRRIPNADRESSVRPDDVRMPGYLLIPAVGIPAMFVILSVLLIRYRRKRG